MKALFTLLFFAALTVRADIFSQVGKIESLDALNTQEYVSDILYIAERNPRFELALKLRPRLDALNLRANNIDAWKMYAAGEIEEFSYFGFKLDDVKRGKISLKDFLHELQLYIQNHK